MPVITTTASLSSRGFSSNTSTLLDGGQWIATITLPFTPPSSGNSGFRLIPTRFGNLYVMTDNSMGISKFDNKGTLVFQQRLPFSVGDYTLCSIGVDNDENIYVGGSTSSNGQPVLVKYNSSGVLQWQKRLTQGGTTFTGVRGIEFDNNNNPLILIVNDGAISRCILAKYNTTGTLLSQRRILLSTTFPKLLGIDVANSSVIVNGVKDITLDYSYIGIYPWSNSTTNNTMLYQTGTGYAYFALPTNTGIVSDSSYYYQVIRITISGTPSYVFQQIDKTTGAINYSKHIAYSGSDIELSGITLDNSGYLYITGTTNIAPYGVYIGKFLASNGSVVWEKNITTTNGVNGNFFPTLYWKNNYLYFIVSNYNTSVNVNNGYIKLSDSGSLADGTYATYFTFTTISSTITTVNSTSTGTMTDSVSTTTFSEATPTYSRSTSTYTITTTAIP
jgi:hypothetical protein